MGMGGVSVAGGGAGGLVVLVFCCCCSEKFTKYLIFILS